LICRGNQTACTRANGRLPCQPTRVTKLAASGRVRSGLRSSRKPEQPACGTLGYALATSGRASSRAAPAKSPLGKPERRQAPRPAAGSTGRTAWFAGGRARPYPGRKEFNPLIRPHP
jgi:hypothetical protein